MARRRSKTRKSASRPRRKARRSVAKAYRKRTRSSRPRRRTSARRRAPVALAAAPRRRRRTRRSAGKVRSFARRIGRRAKRSGFGGGVKGAIKSALPSVIVGAGGLLATRYLTGFFLKDRDNGWMGYAASAGIAVVGYLALRKVKPGLAMPFLVGSGIGLVLRAVTQFMPSVAAPAGISSLYPMPSNGMGAIYPRPAGFGMPWASAY